MTQNCAETINNMSLYPQTSIEMFDITEEGEQTASTHYSESDYGENIKSV